MEFIEKECPKDARKEASEHITELYKIRRKVRIVKAIRVVVYILLYLSFMAALTKDVLFIRRVTGFAALLTGIIGTTVFLVMLGVLNKIANIYVSDAHIRVSFIVAISTKYKK
jgi:hypothetical protein